MIGLLPYGDVEIPDVDEIRAKFDAALNAPMIGQDDPQRELMRMLGLREATG